MNVSLFFLKKEENTIKMNFVKTENLLLAK